MTDITNGFAGGIKPRILIVADVADKLQTLVGLLHDDFATLTASSGTRALELAGYALAPELIVLDIELPGADSLAVLRQLKASPVSCDIPVIVVCAPSAGAQGVDLSLGAADYISQPVDSNLLKLRVLTQLALRRYRRKPLVLLEHLPQRPALLIVDDVAENIHELVEALKADYRLMVANNGPRALELVHGDAPPDLVLLDILMPDMDGYEVCRRIKATPEGNRIPVIFVTVVDATVDKVRGFAVGAADYITKPFDIDEVRARVRTHLELNRLQRHFEQLLEQRTIDLREANEALMKEHQMLEKTLEGTIHTVMRAVEVRDPYTAGHQRRVAELALAIGAQLGLDDNRMHGVQLGAMIHDIGKIGVPAEILSKPSRLMPSELRLVQDHAVLGFQILKDVAFPWPIAEIAHQHHERLDGSGYPLGLRGEQILLEARIVAVADVVESMSSHRPYRPALGMAVALDEIRQHRGTLYDPVVIDACLAAIDAGFHFSPNP